MSFKLCTLVHFGMIFWGKIIEFLKVKQKKKTVFLMGNKVMKIHLRFFLHSVLSYSLLFP